MPKQKHCTCGLAGMIPCHYASEWVLELNGA